MSELLLIWSTSIVLAAAALAWMAGLILARQLREQAEERRERDRRLIQQGLFDIMNGSGDAVGRLRGVRHRSRLMAESLLEIVSLVRGEERERLISALHAFGVDEIFCRRLSRGSVAGRLAAAEALAIFPGEAAVSALREALARARSGELRVGMMRSLIDLSASPELEEVLSDATGRHATDSLLYLPVIGQLVRERPRAALELFGDARLSGDARVILAEALGASGDFRVLRPLCFAARAPEVELRIAAVRALGALGHPAAEATILSALADEVWMVRSAACEAAGRVGLQSAVPALAGRLADPVWWVRFRAGEALGALGEAGRACLRGVAGSGADLSRRAASLALAERGLAVEPA